ncbi:MAG: NACHT domain-containing protein [Prochloraceae cyanobacterium]|nr:NACHT domain-containing protein [Prochloraceae cyanobacterium]
MSKSDRTPKQETAKKRISKIVGDKLKQRLEQKRINQKDIYQLAKCSRTTLTKFLNGENVVSEIYDGISQAFLKKGFDLEQVCEKDLEQIILDIAIAVNGETAKNIQDKTRAAQILESYTNSYKTKYGKLKLLGMSQHVLLESVYTPVKFLDSISSRSFESIDGLEKIYRESQKRRLQLGNRKNKNGIQVANQNQFLMVLGTAGAGKSTLLRRVGLEAFKNSSETFNHSCIPILLELKNFTTNNIDLISSIVEEFDKLNFSCSKEFVTKALEDGKLLILLDGLDEVPEDNSNEVINSIESLVTKYNNNRFIASCRIAAYRSYFKNFIDIELADFDDEQIKNFIDNWFKLDRHKQRNTAKECWDSLNDSNNKAAKDLAQNPLLLTFLCLVYVEYKSFPSKRSQLYNRALDIVLEKWAAEKAIRRKEIYKGFDTELEKVLLAQIAYDNFSEDVLFFTRQDLINYIKKFLADTVENPKYLNGRKVLEAIAIQQGILIERAEGIYSFSHLTFQEFLTALNIYQDFDLTKEIIKNHLSDPRWREVLLLIVGLLTTKPDKFFEAMKQQIETYVDTPKIQNLLAWAEQITEESESNIKLVGKRALACHFALAYAKARIDAEAKDEAKAKAVVKAYYKAEVFAKLYDKPEVFDYSKNYIENLGKAANIYTRFYTRPYTNENYSQSASIYVEHVHTYVLKVRTLTVYNTTVDIDGLLINLDNSRKQTSQIDRSLDTIESLMGEIFETVLDSFKLTTEMIDLSEEEFKSFENYFYTNKLMLDCKEAAVRVKQETWNPIEDSMLRPTVKDN